MWTAPEATDPDNGGSSLVNAAEIVLPCLDAAAARDVVEVGAAGGQLTRVLLTRARRVSGSVTAVEPRPEATLLELAASDPDLRLVERPSPAALPDLGPVDAVILDGDHNHHTVSEELRVLAAGAGGDALPLVILHDVGWPHARRDTYYEPDRIPDSARQPYACDAKLAPGNAGIAAHGLPFGCAAEHEGGPRNGVLTAIEDFLAGRDHLRFARVPVFWGIGFLWSRSASWSDAVAGALAPWTSNPLLERLEAHRVAHLVDLCTAEEDLASVRGHSERQAELLTAQSQLLARMLGSGAFALGERLSRLRQRGEPVFSRQEVERVLGMQVEDAEDDSLPKGATDVASGGGPTTSPAPSAAS